VLVELGAVEQRYRAALEVLEEGVSVTEVARPVRRGPADGARVAAPVCRGGAGRAGGPVAATGLGPASDGRHDRGADRGDAAGASGVGPSRIRWELERAGVVPLPGRSAVYRALVRHGLVQARKRRRRREDQRHWATAGRPPSPARGSSGRSRRPVPTPPRRWPRRCLPVARTSPPRRGSCSPHQPGDGAGHRAVAADRLAVRRGRIQRRRADDRAGRPGAAPGHTRRRAPSGAGALAGGHDPDAGHGEPGMARRPDHGAAGSGHWPAGPTPEVEIGAYPGVCLRIVRFSTRVR
jgi:hypothetical protein